MSPAPVDLVRPHTPSVAETIDAARAAQRAGLSRLWISEVAGFDAVALAARVRAEVPDLPIVVGPMPATLRSGAQLAMAAATLAACGGEFEIVIGASSPAIVAGWHGRAAGRPGTVEAIVDAYHAATSGEATAVDHEVAPSHGFRLRLPITGRVPLGIAALGPRMRALAARRADRLVLNFVDPTQARAFRDDAVRVATEAGRTPPSVTAWLHVAPGADATEREACRAFVARYVRAPGYRENFAARGHADLIRSVATASSFDDVVGALDDGFLDDVCEVGNIDALAARIAEFTDAGIDVALSCPLPFAAGGRRVLDALVDARIGASTAREPVGASPTRSSRRHD